MANDQSHIWTSLPPPQSHTSNVIYCHVLAVTLYTCSLLLFLVLLLHECHSFLKIRITNQQLHSLLSVCCFS